MRLSEHKSLQLISLNLLNSPESEMRGVIILLLEADGEEADGKQSCSSLTVHFRWQVECLQCDVVRVYVNSSYAMSCHHYNIPAGVCLQF